jgi:hypothetical protein
MIVFVLVVPFFGFMLVIREGGAGRKSGSCGTLTELFRDIFLNGI